MLAGSSETSSDSGWSAGARKDDAVAGRGLRQLGQRGGRPDHLKLAALDQLVDMARDGDREGELALPTVGAHQAQVEQQSLLDRDLACLLVDQEEPLAGSVEDDSETSRFAWPTASRSPVGGSLPSAAKPWAETASTPSGPISSGSTYEVAE